MTAGFLQQELQRKTMFESVRAGVQQSRMDSASSVAVGARGVAAAEAAANGMRVGGAHGQCVRAEAARESAAAGKRSRLRWPHPRPIKISSSKPTAGGSSVETRRALGTTLIWSLPTVMPSCAQARGRTRKYAP